MGEEAGRRRGRRGLQGREAGVRREGGAGPAGREAGAGPAGRRPSFPRGHRGAPGHVGRAPIQHCLGPDREGSGEGHPPPSITAG